MTSFLQINIDGRWNLMIATANKLSPDFLIISEQKHTRTEDDGWYNDAGDLCAIAKLKSTLLAPKTI